MQGISAGERYFQNAERSIYRGASVPVWHQNRPKHIHSYFSDK